MWSLKKPYQLFIILLLVLNTSCGFKPLYDQSNGKPQIDNSLAIKEIVGKEGYQLREELIRRFGEPNNESHFLSITLETIKTDEVITPNNEITSYKLVMTANYTVIDKSGNVILPTQKSIARTRFSSASNSTGYATLVAEDAARKRLTVTIGDKISTRMSVLSEKWRK